MHDVSFAVRAGEILGLAGLVGAGRTETARLIFGADPRTAGEILVEGQPVNIRTPRDAIAAGIGLIPEDRKRQGVLLNQSVTFNTVFAALARVSPGLFANARAEREAASRLCAQLQIKTPSLNQLAGRLSGGNQQKVVLAKWLLTESRVLIFDEPTRGIDVGAKQEIYALMRRLSDRGAAIIMISSEMPELLGMSDRILVLAQGRIAGNLQSRSSIRSGSCASPLVLRHEEKRHDKMPCRSLRNPPLPAAEGKVSHGSVLSENYDPTRVTSGCKSTLDGQIDRLGRFCLHPIT